MTTDPRFMRSADALAEAVLALAAERPIERVAVTEIARRAGVTRATFYNHATSPAALLTRVLERDLDAIREDFLAGAAARPTEIETTWRDAELVLVEHVLAHEDVYRRGFASSAGTHGSVLGGMLARHVEASLLTLARSSGASPEEPNVAMAAAFVGQGTVGALRAWLELPGPHVPDVGVDAILALIPTVWYDLVRS